MVKLVTRLFELFQFVVFGYENPIEAILGYIIVIFFPKIKRCVELGIFITNQYSLVLLFFLSFL